MCAVGAGFHFLIFGFWSMLDVWKKKKIIFLVNSVCARVCEREREREAANINIFKQTTLTNHKSHT